MWQGVVPVDSSYDPIVIEKASTKKQIRHLMNAGLYPPPHMPYVFMPPFQNSDPVTILNAGPGTILVRGWHETPDDDDKDGVSPDIEMQVRPGQSRSVVAGLIRVKLMKPHSAGGSAATNNRDDYSAVAWRVN